jgi:hypothetical protein
MAEAAKANKTLTIFNLEYNFIQAKGAAKTAKALLVNHVLTTWHLNGRNLAD